MDIQSAPSYVIENIEIWLKDKVLSQQTVVVENGRFRAMGNTGDSGVHLPASASRIDGRGLVLMPSGVDAQAHLRVPGQAKKEEPETGLLAALKGGYSAVLTMPNTKPTIDTVEVLRQGQELVKPFEERFGVQVFWSASITKRLNSDELTPFDELYRAGVHAFTNDGLGVMSDDVMDQAFARLENIPCPLLQHAEFPGHGGTLAPGSVQEKVGAKPYYDDPEWKMVERDTRVLAKHPKARYHVLHVSAARTLDFVKEAKQKGLRVTAEVSPHHLYFNAEQIDPENKSFKMNPPIRGPKDQERLWDALIDGTLDFVATDHAPHEKEMKSQSFDLSAFGTLGFETTLGVLLDGVRRRGLTRERMVQVFSERPARFLNLPPEYGDFTPGETFHGALIDTQYQGAPLAASSFSSLSDNSCFIGQQLPGKLVKAFHGEKIISFI